MIISSFSMPSQTKLRVERLVFSLVLITLFKGYLMHDETEDCKGDCLTCSRNGCEERGYGFWGPNCEHRCLDCAFCACNKSTGRCLQCKPGQYTEDCSKACPSNCRSSSNVKDCNRESGACDHGCIDGWWGPQCDQRCSQGCSEEVCYQEDGICLAGCKERWNGHWCDHVSFSVTAVPFSVTASSLNVSSSGILKNVYEIHLLFVSLIGLYLNEGFLIS